MKIGLKGIPPINIHRICFALLLIVIFLTMGCRGSRQHASVTSEKLPSEQETAKGLGEPQKGLPMDAVKETPLSSSPEGKLSKGQTPESKRPGDRTPDDQIRGSKIPQGEIFEGQMPATGKREKGKGSPTPTDGSPNSDPGVESSEIAKVTPIPLMEPPEDLALLPKNLTDVFFDYDQFRIRQDAITVLENNAKVLIWRYPMRMVVIQGHCDERGTEEYNLILGERRAVAVKNYLVDLGVPEENIQVISYGKEKPFCLEHSRKCWQQNRRSHLLIN